MSSVIGIVQEIKTDRPSPLTDSSSVPPKISVFLYLLCTIDSILMLLQRVD